MLMERTRFVCYRKIYVDGEDKVCAFIGNYVDGEDRVCVFIGKSMLMERTRFVCL
jgi:hypothetical protein